MSDSVKRRVHIIATGGTIASKPTSATAVVGYAPSVFTVENLLENVPGARDAANLQVEQLMRKQSPDITDADMLKIGTVVPSIHFGCLTEIEAIAEVN